MNITSIQNYQSNRTFCANSHCLKKELLEQPRRIKNDVQNTEGLISKKIERLILSGAELLSSVDLLLKEKGVTYCHAKDRTINFACGQDGGFYQIKTESELSSSQAKEYLFRSIINDSVLLGGFKNYYQLIKDIGRQDLIKKGLKLHTYELNQNVPEKQKNIASIQLTRHTKLPVTKSDLFFIENEAFYYDKVSKTAYGVSMNINNHENVQPVYKCCKFETNSEGKAVGYKILDWNAYHSNYVETEYLEQQEPSTVLPSFAVQEKEKEFAEVFRFGNSKPDFRMQVSAQNVLKHLSEKANINASSNDLQFIKMLDKNKNIIRRIGYYNPATGTSIIYNEDGKYIYQLEYIKDHLGNITLCTKL